MAIVEQVMVMVFVKSALAGTVTFSSIRLLFGAIKNGKMKKSRTSNVTLSNILYEQFASWSIGLVGLCVYL